MGVADAAHYRSHDLRRGRTKDLAAAGASWKDILAQGDWSTRAAPQKAYLPDEFVEEAFALESQLQPSSDESSEPEF